MKSSFPWAGTLPVAFLGLLLAACGGGGGGGGGGSSGAPRGTAPVSSTATVRDANISCSPGVIAKDVQGSCSTQCTYNDNGQVVGPFVCRDITWTSSNPSALQIDSVSGTFVGVAPAANPVKITATSARDTALNLSTVVRVNDAGCNGLAVYPVDGLGNRITDPGVGDRLTVVQGTTQRFRADCLFTNSQGTTSTGEVTRRALWSSSDIDVAEIFDIDDASNSSTDLVGIAYTLRSDVPSGIKGSSLPTGRNDFLFNSPAKSALITGEYCGVSSFNLIEVYPALTQLCVERSPHRLSGGGTLSEGGCEELLPTVDTSCRADTPEPAILVNGVAQFYALGTFKATAPNGGSKIYRCNLTNDSHVVWATAATADDVFIAISNRNQSGGGAGLVTGKAVGIGNLKATYTDQARGIGPFSDGNQQRVFTTTNPPDPQGKVLTGLQVTPKFFCVGAYDVVGSLAASAASQSASVLPGSQQMTAIATYSDASTAAVTAAPGMMWSTGAPAVTTDGYWDGQQCVAVPPAALAPLTSASPAPFGVSAQVSTGGVVSPTGVLRIGTACVKGSFTGPGPNSTSVTKTDGGTVLVLPVTNVNIGTEVCQQLGAALSPLFLEGDGGAGPLTQLLGNLLSPTNPLLLALDSGATTGPTPTCGATQVVAALTTRNPAAIQACFGVPALPVP